MTVTQPSRPQPPPEDTQPSLRDQAAGSGRFWRWFGAMLAFVVAVMLVAIGTGYAAGLRARERTREQRLEASAQEQFDLGVEDLLAGRYSLARQRFEYVLELEPDYPGAAELLDRSLQALNQPTITPSPAVSPTPVQPTPTPDVSSLEAIFQSAQESFAREDWDGVLSLLLLLRAEAPDFRLTEANQLMYGALRNRGLEKIFSGDREQGIYDLTLAARFQPLDNQAASWVRTASFYSFANSFFGLDWGQAAEHFASLCRAGVWDSCWKYAQAAKEYANELQEEDACQAAYYYEQSLTTRDDAALYPTATRVYEACLTATAPAPTPTGSGTPGTGTPDGTGTATATPTPPPGNRHADAAAIRYARALRYTYTYADTDHRAHADGDGYARCHRHSNPNRNRDTL